MLSIKRKSVTLWAVFLSILFSFVYFFLPAGKPVFSEEGSQTLPVYVLDAGHGGEDGGALSADGDKESEINLAITQKLEGVLQFLGQKTLLTRREDISIYSGDAQTLREKKASDLRNRVAIANSVSGGILISIHQNSLPMVPSVHGAQTFFGRTEHSSTLASCVQAALNRSVNPDNTKKEKAMDPSVYLIKKAACPAILVECGFMTNPTEVNMLKSPDYQTKLAVAITAGVLCAGREAEQ